MARNLPTNRKGKTYEELYGKDKSQEIQKKMSESHKGYRPSEEVHNE